MAREILSYGYRSTLITVGVGASNALLIVPIAREVSSILKYFTGGSLEIIHATAGSTAVAGNTVIAGQGYLLGTTEAISVNGCPKYILCATGATAQAYLLKGLSDSQV